MRFLNICCFGNCRCGQPGKIVDWANDNLTPAKLIKTFANCFVCDIFPIGPVKQNENSWIYRVASRNGGFTSGRRCSWPERCRYSNGKDQTGYKQNDLAIDRRY